MTMKPFIAKFFPNLFLSAGGYQRHDGEAPPRTIGAASLRTKALHKPKDAHLADGSTDRASARGSDRYFKMEDLSSRENDISAALEAREKSRNKIVG
jgi:hypothetical protein